MIFPTQAGLFSAVLTAFVIESYQSLREDPAQTTVDLLRYISHQLANPSLPAVPDPVPFHADRSDMQVNVCWFVSLLLSLFVALFGIFFKQWMRSYMKWTDVTPYKDAVGLRHFRYRTLESWHIETILAFLPTLLQIAVVLFLGGLLVFLSGSVPSLTIIMTVFSGVVCFFVVAATVLPGFSQSCPYRSSLSQFVALPIRYVLDRVKSALHPALKAAVQEAFRNAFRNAFRKPFYLAVEAVFIVAWNIRSQWLNLLDSDFAQSVTSVVQPVIMISFRHAFYPQSLLRRLREQHAELLSSWPWGGQPRVVTLSTSWLDADMDTLDRRRASGGCISMRASAMAYLCNTTQLPHLWEAAIPAIMSEYPEFRLTPSRNDDAYCNEVWWPVIGGIMLFNKEYIDDLSRDSTAFRMNATMLGITVNSQFNSFTLSMQHCWVDFLVFSETLVCRSQSKHVIAAYLVCCAVSVDSHGGGRRMLALVAVLQVHHLKLDKRWLDSIADSISMFADIWKDGSDDGQVSPYNWNGTSGKLFCEMCVFQCFDHTSGAEFIKSMQDFCEELQHVQNMSTTQTGKYQQLLDVLAQLACQVALAMEPEPYKHVPKDLKSFLVALRGVHKICSPYQSQYIWGSCATALVCLARSDEPDLFPKSFARAMVRQIEGSHLLAVAQDVAGLDLEGVDMSRLWKKWGELDDSSRGVIERLIEPKPFAKILDAYEDTLEVG
jgi:hypothetical protein